MNVIQVCSFIFYLHICYEIVDSSRLLYLFQKEKYFLLSISIRKMDINLLINSHERKNTVGGLRYIYVLLNHF